MKPNPLLSSKEGLTLIEIMIALVILSVGLLALSALQIAAIRGNAFSQRMTTAVSIAEQRIEQLKNTPFANIQAEGPAQVTASNLNFTREVTVNNNSPLPNTKTVSITVSWMEGSSTFTVPITTIIAQ